ncbi:hypothetical protein BJEO58_02093 [Brevibacterium jeotgali]|uniref:Tetratricopeptide repeat-containing protein n=1 Tax=Brevibacterium jeotgali TaxID=1262550 RepID=A0A2H1L6H1_9MICO|nr:hypothetical protein FB108_1268 [Brevibacterium jeotgali]SMY12496.1 hypothetical protein BJEO58_02093 [Brevibacterium jeotgali]
MAYHTDRYEEALRELRTHRRISGSDDNLPLIADAERGRGRPQKALEIFSEASEEALGHDLYTELLMVAAGAHMDRGEVAEARALLETRNFAGNANGTLVRLLSVYSDVIRLQGDADLAGRYEELARRTAKATGTLFGDEAPDPNANVEIVTLEEIELPDEEPEHEEASGQEAGSPGADPADEVEHDAAPAAGATVDTTSEESVVEDQSAGSPADEDRDASTHTVDAEFPSETVDELEEILAEAETEAPADDQSEKAPEAAPAAASAAVEESDAPQGTEHAEAMDADSTAQESTSDDRQSADSQADDSPSEESPSEESPKADAQKKEPAQDVAPDDDEELTEPLFDL